MADFRLVLYRGASGEIVPVTTYLEMDDASRANVAASFEHVSVSLVVDEQERLAYSLSLGSLRRLAPQFEPARQRLLSGQPALIRSGVLDVPDGNYLFFEPTDDVVRVSILKFDDLPVSGWFPDEPKADELYSYVSANRDTLIDKVREMGDYPVELAFNGDELLIALEREATAGASLLSSLDKINPEQSES